MRSWRLLGAAQRWRAVRARTDDAATSGMREDVDLRPAGEIERGAARQEMEACLRQFQPTFADQAALQLVLESVKKADVGCGVVALRLRQLGAAPV